MNGSVETVLGPVNAGELGPTLVHEHLFVDTRTKEQKESTEPAPRLSLDNYYLSRRHDDNAFSLVLDSLSGAIDEVRHFAAAGGGTIVDVTPLCLGRQPAQLAELARGTGVRIVMGGGFYDHPYHDERVHDWPVERLTDLIVSDCLEGVPVGNGQRVKSGVIGELALSWPVADCEHKALVAAARAQARTGVTLVIHPGRHPDAPREAIEVAAGEGADPARIVMSHLDRTLDDADALAAVARTGAFVAFDLFGNESSYYPYSEFAMPNDAMRLKLLRAVADRGFAESILLSQDIYQKTRWVRYGGEGYAHILRDVVPVMGRFGFDKELQHLLLVENPARALTGVRPSAAADDAAAQAMPK